MRVRTGLAAVLIVGFVLWGAFPGASQSPSLQADEFPTAWLVELASAPLAGLDGTLTPARQQNHLATLAVEQQAFRNAARAAGIVFRERRSFRVLFNGLAIEVAPSRVPMLARLQGVKALWPVLKFSLPPIRQVLDPQLATALAMTGADVAQSELGLTGAGVRVAIIDTGIDYHHPDLGGCFGPGCRVAFGYDFVGDAFNADPSSPGYNPVPVPDPDPDDCNGHGTHVAGIVGASGNFATGGARGVAPAVTFGAYRVFGCEGSTTSDIIIAALERALADRMHVVNMSLGSAFQWPEHPTAVASDLLVKRGVVVVASIGNNGANGVYSSGSPGVGSRVIGVASYDNSHVALTVFTISPDGTQIGYANAAGAPPAPTSGSLPMSRTGTPATPNDACSPLPPGSHAGRAVLIRRGTCTFHTKALNAQNAGAAAVVLYNNVPGRFSPSVSGTPAITIPVVAISDAEGVLIDGRIAAGPVTMTWTNITGTFVNPTGGLISSFSSYGLSPDLALKPDIGAPGGLIRSTWPLERGGYATISGTSMSSPHVAGGVALLLQARPGTDAHMVRTLLMNSADPKPWWGGTPPGSTGFLDNVHRQGAGMLDIDDTILATTRVDPGKLALGESQAGPAVRTLTIVNRRGVPVTYTLSHEPALGTHGSTFSPSFNTSFATVTFSASSVTVPADTKATVTVTITPPTAPDRGQYGGYIVFTPTTPGQVYRVPYAGFIGDYQSIQAMTPTPFGFPWLAKLVGGSFVNQPGGATFTLTGGDVPYILVHLDHQVQILSMEVSDARTGRVEGFAIYLNHVGRNSTATAFFAIPWDGVTTTKTGTHPREVPDGQYVIRLAVLKALGERSNPAHWESWTSPVITLDRP
jgi:subtilisin family serine protease